MTIKSEVVTEGHDVASALRAALDALQASEDEVEIIVEQKPSKGLFGLGRRPARVRVRRRTQPVATDGAAAAAASVGAKESVAETVVSVKDEGVANIDGEAPSSDAAPETENWDGTVAIQGGRVVLQGARGRGRQPAIRPGPHTRVLVNGQVIDTFVEVTPEDDIQVEAVDVLPFVDIDVQLADDRYAAYISVARQHGTQYELVDAPPGYRLTVTARAAGQLPAPVPTVQDLEQALAAKGVVYGIDPAALQQLALELEQSPEASPRGVLVASGIPVEPTVDERLVLMFETETRVRTEAEGHQVDLLGLYRLSSVKAGDVLAVVHPGRKGRAGRTVTGKDVPVHEPREARVRAGSGVTWHPAEGHFTADYGGRPQLVRDVLSVLPKHTVNGDVDAKTGHIHFDGDVEVTGSVNESVQVVASGGVTVRDSVSNARVEAGTSVAIGRNVARSHVIAGSQFAHLVDLLGYLRPLAHDLDHLLRAVRQAKTYPRLEQVTDGRLVKMLMEQKFTRLEKHVTDLSEHVRTRLERGAHKEFTEFVAQLHRRLVGLGPISLNDLSELEQLHQQCGDFLDGFSRDHEQGLSFDAVVRHVHNSEVRASGKIVFQQRAGCFYSHLFAGYGITMESGAFRGDSATVHQGNIVMDEVGSPLEAEVHLHIVTEGVFQARKVHPGVRVTIGTQSYKFDTEARGVRARLVDGELNVT